MPICPWTTRPRFSTCPWKKTLQTRLSAGKLKKRTALTWTPGGIKAFEDLRALTASCPLLHFPDETSPITLRTDASDYGVGGVLFQTVADIENPVAFVSKSFTEVQLRWSVIQKEAYAIFYCCTTLDYLLRDRKFVIETDHRNLLYLRKNTNSMVIRWDIALQELDYTVGFLSGSKNVIADSMSRLCLNFIEVPDIETMAALENFKEIAEDKIEPLTQCHNSIIGHGGLDRTLSNLQQLGFDWPYMRQDIKHFILTCPVCQKLNTAKNIAKTYPFTTFSDRPMKVLNIDFVGPFPKGEHILVVIDTHSRWIELFHCPDATAKSAANALLEHFGRYGTFHELRSDRGPHFVNAIIKQFLRLTDTHHHLTLAYSNEENAIVERANREVNRHLKALFFDSNSTDDIKLQLPFVHRIINATPNTVTKIKPSQILFGNLIDLDENILTPTPDILAEASLTETTDKMIRTQEQLIDRSTKFRRLADSTRLANHDLPDKDFSPGTFVLIQYTSQPPSRVHRTNESNFKQGFRIPFAGFNYQERETHSRYTHQRISFCSISS